MKLLLVGAGGHARNVCEAVHAAGHELGGYVDPTRCNWLNARQWADDEAADAAPAELGIVLGVGGVVPAQLAARLALLERYRAKGRRAPAVAHPRAYVSESAAVEDAALTMAGAVVQGGCVIGRGALINSGAIVEHDSRVGEGAHVAPGAIVLGMVKIGPCVMIGAGAVILPGAEIPGHVLIKAGAVYPASSP